MLMLRIHMRMRVLKDCGIAIDAGAMCLQVQETFHFAQTRRVAPACSVVANSATVATGPVGGTVKLEYPKCASQGPDE